MREDRLDLLAVFSSAISFTDSAGQAAYAAASTFQDAYAQWTGLPGPYPVRVLNWGFWGSVGVVADERYGERLAAFGVGSIEPAEGLAALDRVLAAGLPQAVVVKADGRGLAQLGVRAEADDALARARGRLRRTRRGGRRPAPRRVRRTAGTAAAGGADDVRGVRRPAPCRGAATARCWARYYLVLERAGAAAAWTATAR